MSDEPAGLPEQDALQHLVATRYGSRLTPEAAESVRQGVEEITQALAALRAVPLANHDEPFTLFQPYRQEA
jgi:hypothetical protein